MKRPKIISKESFDNLKDRGHVVPRDEKGYIMDNTFAVSREYIVKYRGGKEFLSVRCTQDCPTNLKLIQP